MGIMQHHTIIVTHWDEESLRQVHQAAERIFCNVRNLNEPTNLPPGLVSPIIGSAVNGQCSFFIAPDGSKEGWTTSEEGNQARQEFKDWIRDREGTRAGYCQWVEVEFGELGYEIIDNDEEERGL